MKKYKTVFFTFIGFIFFLILICSCPAIKTTKTPFQIILESFKSNGKIEYVELKYNYSDSYKIKTKEEVHSLIEKLQEISNELKTIEEMEFK